MSSIEKKMIGAMLVLVVLLGVSCAATMDMIADNGGMKNLIIEAGKEIKDISAEIDKHETE